ncbi:MAG TPA: glycosyltransferase family 9 protein [Rhodocyclaceae bacterium]
MDPAGSVREARARDGWRRARRILAVRLDSLGDVLMTSPALRALRQRTDGRSITLLAAGSGAAAAARVPEIDDVIELPCPWMPGEPMPGDDVWEALLQIRARRFDAAVIFTAYSQSALPAALLCWQAGVPLRLAHCRENPYHLLTDWIADPEPHTLLRHEVRRQLDLVASVGCFTEDERLSFRIDAAEVEAAARKLRAAGVEPLQPRIVLHPGASAASRRYPVERFGEALRLFVEARAAMQRHDGYQLVLTGSAQEADLCEALRQQLAGVCNPVSLAGALTLGELGAVIATASLLISNNTGPVHIAAALGTPVVDVYALTNPQHAPWQVPHRVLTHDVPCRFCYRSACPQTHHDCLRLLDPARVAEAAHALLAEGADRIALPIPGRPATPAVPLEPAGEA